MSNLENKLSTLSTIPEKALVKLREYLNRVHSHDVVTQLIEDKDLIELDIFEGTLYITVDKINDTIKYKFIPNDEFNKIITKSIVEEESLLIAEVSTKLKSALVNTYKDLI